ncbi:MAG: bacillithiol biosynthesis deacetylase BshB1 [Bacteroidota bacterium]
MKVDILAITAHPDDVELSCCGTLLHQIALGKTVGLVDLTRGELGTRGTPEIREAEAMAAAQKMGASIRVNLGMPDGFFTHSRENLLKVVRVIRQYQPEIVLANAVHDRHPDHGKAAKLISEACFLAGLAKVRTLDNEGLTHQRWRPKVIYHMIQDYTLEPDFVVDISPYIDKKMELILTFRSQFFDPSSGELDSPISGQDFLEYIRHRARIFGRPAGMEFAEGFTVQRTIGVKDLFDLV